MTANRESFFRSLAKAMTQVCQYSSLSIGLISKILCIKDSIQRGRRKFDFLKGAEEYKYRLGGKEISRYDCQIFLSDHNKKG